MICEIKIDPFAFIASLSTTRTKMFMSGRERAPTQQKKSDIIPRQLI
jgi:hypothetical protein